MGRAARPLHDPGNHRSVERGSNLQAARRGGLMKPAKPAGERENTAALTPSLGTRSSRFHQNDPFLARGTDGSNPSPSTGESTANLTPSIRVPKIHAGSRPQGLSMTMPPRSVPETPTRRWSERIRTAGP